MSSSGREESTPSPEALTEILDRAAIERRLCERASSRVTKLPGKRMNSALYYVESTAFPKPAIVKLYLDPATGLRHPELAKQQFRAMTRASAAMGSDSRFRVAQPYLLLEAESLVAAEWIPGTTLTTRLTRWRASRSDIEHDLRQTGIWLSQLHQALAVAPGPLDSMQRAPVLSEWASSQQCEKGVPKRALRTLQERACDAASQLLHRSRLHGDFKPDNVVLTDGSTAGIDLGLKHENCSVYDLAAFLNHLDILCHEPTGWHLYPVRKRLQAAFLDGYFRHMNGRRALPLLWIRLYLLLGSRIEGRRGRFAVVQDAIGDSGMKGVLREWDALR